MKKNKLLLILTMLSLFMISGCDNKSQQSSNNNDTKIEELNNLDEYTYESTIKCDALKNAKYFNYGKDNNWFVTKNNDVYVYSIYNLYSNDTNCKKIAGKFDDIVFNDIEYNWNTFKYVGNEAYYNSKLEKVSVDYNSYSIIKEQIDSDIYKEIRADLASINESEYTRIRKVNVCTAMGIKNDNNLYLFALRSSKDYEFIDKSTITNEEIIYSVPDNEKILDFYFSSRIYAKGCFFNTNYNDIEEDMGKKYIITDKAYYRPMLKDESCLKYQDIECEYVWKKDAALSKIKDDILYKDEFNLITRQGKIYGNSNYYIGD